jgi:hypothetical protein
MPPRSQRMSKETHFQRTAVATYPWPRGNVRATGARLPQMKLRNLPGIRSVINWYFSVPLWVSATVTATVVTSLAGLSLASDRTYGTNSAGEIIYGCVVLFVVTWVLTVYLVRKEEKASMERLSQGLQAFSEEVERQERSASRPRRETIPRDVMTYVWRRDEGRCIQCGSQERLEFDHIIPVSKGGSYTARNLQLLCERCNRAKSGSI